MFKETEIITGWLQFDGKLKAQSFREALFLFYFLIQEAEKFTLLLLGESGEADGINKIGYCCFNCGLLLIIC